MAINRYSRLTNPTIVNPISFEEFTQVPLAREQAKAAGLQATTSIGTDYYVDQKDLEDVTNAVSIIDKGKETLVNSIVNDGITNQTVNEFVKIKQSRDKVYKDYIDKVQRNKIAIDQWKQQVDKMYGAIDPSYAERVKQKGYQAWQGTMQQTENGIQYSDFQPHYGVKYWDVDADIQNVMRQVGETTLAEFKRKGQAIIPNKILGGFDIVDASGNIVTSNYKQLGDALNLLGREYSSPDTDRGRFAAYTDIDMDKLSQKLNDYANIYSSYSERPFGGDRRFVQGQQQQNQGFTPSALTELTPVQYKTNLPSNTNRFLNKYVAASDRYAEMGKGDTFWDKAALSFPFNFKALKRISDSWKQAGEDIKGTVYDSKVIVESYPQVAQYLVSNNTISKDLYAKALSGDDEAIADVSDEIKDYMKDVSSKESRQQFYVGDHLNTAWGDKLKNDPKGASKDLGNFLNSLTVYSSTNRNKALTGDKKDALQNALLQGKAEVVGVLPLMSDLTFDSKSDYVRDLSRGNVVRIEPEYARKNDLDLEYVTSRIWEPNEPDRGFGSTGYAFKTGQAIEEYLGQVPIGTEAPIFIYSDNGQIIPAVYYANPIGQLSANPNDRGVVREVHFNLPNGESRAVKLDQVSGRIVNPKEYGKFLKNGQ